MSHENVAFTASVDHDDLDGHTPRLSMSDRSGHPLPEEGSQLGRYVVIGELGRGGMGVVLRAYDPKLQREVALKCLKPDALSTEMHARLVREAQAMAKLSHPNVVAVYDVDLEGERVTLAMEYVEGQTLDAWLAARQRTPTEILAKFIEAGRGLAAAHEAGLLHRDFKPSNVLVARSGGVKVTDFGVARLDEGPRTQGLGSEVPLSGGSSQIFTQATTGSAAALTHAGAVMGTPAYMAPEQHHQGTLTAAIDQYAFCVSVWQALTGELPFPVKGRTIRQLGKDKVAGPPPWPHRRRESKAGAGKGSPGVHRRWIEAIRRGLAPDPAQRWPDMHALLSELAYDPRRRRRTRAIAGSTAIAALGGIAWPILDRAAVTAACEDEGRAITRTWNAERAGAVADAFAATGIAYAPDTWSRAVPRISAFAEEWERRRTEVCLAGERDRTRSTETLERARACFDEQRTHLDNLAAQWLAPTQTIVAATATAAWSLPRLDACADEAELLRRSAGEGDGAEIEALRARLAEAAALGATAQYADALAIVEGVVQLATELDQPGFLAEVHAARAGLQQRLGRYRAASTSLEAAYRYAERAGDDEQVLDAAAALASLTGARLASHDDADRWLRIATLKQERLRLSSDHPSLAGLWNSMGTLDESRGRNEDALAAFERVLSSRQAALGSDHPEVAVTWNNIGLVLDMLGRGDEAIAAHRRALAIWEHALGPNHPQVAYSHNNIGLLHGRAGRLDDALEAHRRALAIREGALPSDHPELGGSLLNIAVVQQQQGRFEETLTGSERALAILERAHGSDHPHVGLALITIAKVHLVRDDHDRALQALARALEIFERTDHPNLIATLETMARIHLARREPRLAIDALRRALAHPKLAPEGRDRANLSSLLSQAQQGAGKPANARP